MSETITNTTLLKPSSATLTQTIIAKGILNESFFDLKVTFENYSGSNFTITHQGDLEYTIENGPATSTVPQTQTGTLQIPLGPAPDDIGKTFSVSNAYQSDQVGKFIGKTDPFTGVVKSGGDGDPE